MAKYPPSVDPVVSTTACGHEIIPLTVNIKTPNMPMMPLRRFLSAFAE